MKTTGGKGLHVVAARQARARLGRAQGVRAVAWRSASPRRTPTRYTTNIRKRDRNGRIFLDYLRNGRGATAVVAYSTRAREGAPVATPLFWEELEAGVDPHAFTVATVPPRIAQQERDPWEEYAGLRQALPGAKRAQRSGAAAATRASASRSSAVSKARKSPRRRASRS